MNICIVGAGNIGMRYHQGILATLDAAKVTLVDQPHRLDELGQQNYANTTLASSIDQVETQIDLFVVATSSAPRLALYKQCLVRNPTFVILDKYLFASRAEFDQCLALDRVTTFVNQWMHGSGCFDCLFEEPRQQVELRGSGWGLGCNAVHWIDVFKRHLGITELALTESSVISAVFPAKRPGYQEVAGQLVLADCHSDKTITLIDQPDAGTTDGMTIRVDEREYFFNYREIIRDGAVLSRFPYFSAQIGGIVRDIMARGQCALPSLEESISQHLLVEDALATLDQRPRIT